MCLGAASGWEVQSVQSVIHSESERSHGIPQFNQNLLLSPSSNIFTKGLSTSVFFFVCVCVCVCVCVLHLHVGVYVSVYAIHFCMCVCHTS